MNESVVWDFLSRFLYCGAIKYRITGENISFSLKNAYIHNQSVISICSPMNTGCNFYCGSNGFKIGTVWFKCGPSLHTFWRELSLNWFPLLFDTRSEEGGVFSSNGLVKTPHTSLL